MFQGFACDFVHDGHGPFVDECSGESSLGCLPGPYVNLLSELPGVNFLSFYSSYWLVGQLGGCS